MDQISLMVGKDVVEGWELLHKYIDDKEGVDPYYNKIAARSLLSFPISRPATAAHRIVAPYLVVVPEYDSVAPKAAAEQVARVAKQGELLEVEGGHFDLYRGGVGYERNLRGQLEFLKRVVPL